MKDVVGAAVVRDGCVLAARRTRPAATAGRWEFPGGKVEPGESPEQALVREVAEELGCRVEVDGWLAGSAAIGGTHRLSVARCRLVDGAVRPVEHDAVRWLAPEELDDVDWLEPDRPFLAELREVLLDGAALPGGNVGGAVRVGDTVRRPVGPWTPAVHRLLAHLHEAGLDAVPRVHGLDTRGREVLDHLPGEVIDVDTDVLTDARLAALVRWARRLHDAVTGFRDPGPWRFFGVAAPQLVAHNDLAPYNACFDGEELSGVFDWDLAGPSTPLMELAHLAWNAVPLFRPVPEETAAARLRLITEEYGDLSPAALLAAVPTRVTLAIEGIREAVRRGDEGMRNLVESGELARTEQRLDDLVVRAPRIAEILAR